MLVLAFAIFVGGAALSINRLALKPSDIVLAPLALLVLGVVPAAIAYSSINIMLMGKAVGAPIGFVEGMRISVLAQVAELLPIPGGAIVDECRIPIESPCFRAQKVQLRLRQHQVYRHWGTLDQSRDSNSFRR